MKPAFAPISLGVREFRRLRDLACIVILTCTSIQVLFFGAAPDNLEALLLNTTSGLLGILYALDIRRFQASPISALILLFFTLTSISGALIAKTIEWAPLSDRLTVPITTFAVLAYTQVILILTHAAYLNAAPLQRMRHFGSEKLLSRLGLFTWPTAAQLWALGLLGCFSILAVGANYEVDAQFGSGVAGEKLFRAFAFLRFAPFMIPFRDQLAGERGANQSSGAVGAPRPILGLLAIYFSALVAISFVTNSRSTFADALPTLAICALLALASGRLTFNKIPKVKIALIVGVGLLMMALLTRIALAMVVARAYRDSVDANMLVTLTIEAILNSEWLNTVKDTMDASVAIGFYSEDYVDSRFLSRFLLTKFHDNMLQYFAMFGADETKEYWHLLADEFIATLPDPILTRLGFNIDKASMLHSNGDFVVFLIDGWGLGGYKTGSFIAELFSLLGWWFAPGMFCMALCLFMAYDLFALRRPSGDRAISPLILMLAWNLVGTTAAFGLGAESMHQIPSGILRGLPQNIVIYLLARLMVSLVVRPLKTRRPLRSVAAR